MVGDDGDDGNDDGDGGDSDDDGGLWEFTAVCSLLHNSRVLIFSNTWEKSPAEKLNLSTLGLILHPLYLTEADTNNLWKKAVPI